MLTARKIKRLRADGLSERLITYLAAIDGVLTGQELLAWLNADDKIRSIL